MKILMLHSLFPTSRDPLIIGGAEVSVLQLARELAHLGDEVHAVRLLEPGRDPYTISEGGVTVHAIPSERPYWLYGGPYRSIVEKAMWHFADDLERPSPLLAPIVRALAPDVALTHNLVGLGSAAFSLLKQLSIPILHTLHDYYLLCPRMTMFKAGANCTHQCVACAMSTLCRRARSSGISGVVGVGQHILEKHVKQGLFADSHIRAVVPNAIKEVGVTSHNRPWTETRFGFIGRIAPEKGVEHLARAFGRTPKNATLTIAGRSSPEQERQLRIIAGREITFSGFVQPELFFQAIDVLVIPSLWHEPFGRVSIEAQSHGVPVVCANRGELPATILGGSTGWTFEPNEANALENVLNAIALDKEASIQRKLSSIPRVLSVHSTSTQVARYKQIIHSIVALSQHA